MSSYSRAIAAWDYSAPSASCSERDAHVLSERFAFEPADAGRRTDRKSQAARGPTRLSVLISGLTGGRLWAVGSAYHASVTYGDPGTRLPKRDKSVDQRKGKR